MKIKIWFDFQCPFCYMGEKELEKALSSMELTEPVIIEYKAYELDPKAPVSPVESMTDHFMSGHDLTRQEAEERMDKITRMAQRVGLEYNLAEVKVCNTLDAHRLMKYAAEHVSPGKLKKLSDSLFKAVLEEGLLISDRELLADRAATVGLSREEVRDMLEEDTYTDLVRRDESELDSRMDFEFIPFMLLPDGSLRQGVVSEEGLKNWLGAAMNGTTASSEDEPHEGCGPAGCGI